MACRRIHGCNLFHRRREARSMSQRLTKSTSLVSTIQRRAKRDRYISGGIYCLKDKALDVLTDCIQQGMSRMRNFQRQLVAAGLHLTAHPFDKIIDVDHNEDIGKAERFLNEEMAQETGTLIGIGRGSQYSPNLADSDASILKAVARQLQDKGFEVQLVRKRNSSPKTKRKSPVQHGSFGRSLAAFATIGTRGQCCRHQFGLRHCQLHPASMTEN